MFARNSGLSILVTLLTVATVGCSQKANNDKQVEIKPQNLEGGWEVVGIRANKKTDTVFMQSIEAEQAGYRSSNETWQYSFDGDSMQMIISDEVGVKVAVTSPYQVQGRRMEPTTTVANSAAKLMGFTIVHLYADHIEAILDFANSPEKHFILRRITAAELAINKIKTGPNTMHVNYWYGKTSVDQTYTGNFRDLNGEYAVGCRASKLEIGDKVQMIFGLTATLIRKDKKSNPDIDGEDEHIDIALISDFDFTQKVEKIRHPWSKLVKFDALVKKEPTEAGTRIYANETSDCLVEIKRNDRAIEYKVGCGPITSVLPNSRGFAQGNLDLDGTCTLDFN